MMGNYGMIDDGGLYKAQGCTILVLTGLSADIEMSDEHSPPTKK
jgi:hypothetical protein